METIAERIIKIVDALGMSKSEFARKINVTPAYISKLGKFPDSAPSGRTISDICQKFNVAEAWLRDGVGPMFLPKSRNEELMEFATKAAEGDPGNIRAQLLDVMARLTDEQWEVLAQVAREFVEETKKAGPK